jgi:hypothetical protein
VKYKVGLALSCLLVVIFLLTPAASADVNGRIRGTVVDAQNATIAGATVKVTNIDTGYERTVTTGDTGGFDVAALPPAVYSVTITKDGFRTYKQDGIKLQAAQVFEVSATLEIGAISSTVEVGAPKLQADPTTMQLGGEIVGGDITNYPLLNRAWINLQQGLPGVVASSDRFTSNFATNGARTQSNNYLVNGTDSNDLPLNTPIANAINPDAIQEVKVVDSSLNPEYGRNSGATLMVTTKSGTNNWHGSAFEFYRDTFMNSKNYFSAAGASPPPFHQNQFGGSFGGPIKRNKLFGFFAYQGTRSKNGTAQNVSVFTNAERAGNFSGDLKAIANGPGNSTPFAVKGDDGASHAANTPWFGATTVNGAPSALFPTVGVFNCGNATVVAGKVTACSNPNFGILGTSVFNSISTTLLNKFVPAANDSTGGKFLFSTANTSKPNQYVAKVDYNLSSKDSLFFYFFEQRNQQTNTLPFTGANLPGFTEIDGSKIYQYTISDTHIFSQSMLNEFKVGYNRFNFDAVEPQTPVLPSTVGFTGIVPQNPKSAGLPVIPVTGLFTLGFSDNGPQPRIDEATQLVDNFSYTTGKHAYKWGIDFRRGQVSNPFFFVNSGHFDFANNGSFGTGAQGVDFLLGIPDDYNQSSGSVIKARAWEYYSYIQDQWRIRSNLTFTYGIGWQIDTPLTDLFNNKVAINAFRPSPAQQSTVFPTAPAGLVFPGDPGVSASGYRTHYNNFAPRLGFAWQTMKKLTVRAGWGVYYNNSEEELTLQNLLAPPFSLFDAGASDFPLGGSPTFSTPFCDITGAGCNVQKYPFAPLKSPTASDWANFFEPFGLNVLDPNFNVPYAMNYNLTTQYQVTPTILTTFSYVGSQGRRLEGVVEQNPYNATTCLAIPACKANRNFGFLFPTIGTTANPSIFGSVGQQGTFLTSNYNSFQATVEKALSHGLNLRAAYTYSHALDNGSSFENGNMIPSDHHATYGNSQFDARQRLVMQYLYQVPDWGFHHLPSRLTKGWTFSGVTSFQAGFPIRLTESSARSLQCSPLISFYGCWDRPQVAGPLVQFSDPRTTQTIPGFNGGNPGHFGFDPRGFVAETLGTVGNAGRDYFHGPGINNTDISFYKDTNLRENLKLQLRVDLFNAFNHAQFNNPSGNVSSGLFGQVTSTRIAARITQLSASFNF